MYDKVRLILVVVGQVIGPHLQVK